MAARVGADRSSSDAFLKVETHGIDAIPDGERHGHPRELGFLWAGAFVNYASLLTASLLTTYYGLGVWDGLLAVLIGSLSGAVILGLLSNTGPRTGQPQIVFTRRIFGTRGAYPGAVLTLFLGVGWFAVDTVIAALAGVQLLQVAGLGPELATRFLFPWVLVIAALSVVVAVYGHRTIKVFETFGALTFAALSVLVFALLASQMHWTVGPSVSGADYPGAFVLGLMSCFALVASWYPFASDYSRYLPATTSFRSVTLWPIVGVTLPMLLLGLFGLLLPTIDPKLASAAGVLAVITRHAPAAVAVPFFAFVILGEIWANYLDVYTAGLVIQTLGIRLKRWQTALGAGILGAAIATVAVVVWDFHLFYEDFLILTYLWAPAWAAVVLLSFFVFGRGQARPALLAWLLGTALSLIFVNYPNLFATAFPNAHFPNQPLIDALHGADISGAIAVLVAGGAYLALRKVMA
ncbi:MAG TPA: cytosine permease [Candidatus Dormibacteraeota bacterium]|jgi:NCS1 family nucleobase:cation symporter-1